VQLRQYFSIVFPGCKSGLANLTTTNITLARPEHNPLTEKLAPRLSFACRHLEQRNGMGSGIDGLKGFVRHVLGAIAIDLTDS
jgi:hypothetical protein